jgi:hypothetical protein
VTKIRTDWTSIKTAYQIPATALIGGYEFVSTGSDNHVFVDIVYAPKSGSGVYDAKLLYEYDVTTFKRKLIGFFEYNTLTK